MVPEKVKAILIQQYATRQTPEINNNLDNNISSRDLIIHQVVCIGFPQMIVTPLFASLSKLQATPTPAAMKLLLSLSSFAALVAGDGALQT